MRRTKKRRIIVAALLLAAATVALDIRATDWLLTYGEHQASARVTEIVSGAVSTVLRDTPAPVATVVRDEEGRVTSLQTDAAVMGDVQAAVSERLSAAWKAEPTVSFSVPAGTLIGGAWTSGRGPDVTFYLTLDGVALVTPRETFAAVGINQSCHTVYLDVRVRCLLMAAGRQRAVEFTVPVIVSQTVLVGGVPGTYISVEK